MDLSQFTAKSAVDALKKGDISPKDLIEASVKAIEEDGRREDKLNAVIEVNAEKALKDLENLSNDTLLAGLPIFVKDNMNVNGRKVQCASKIIDGYVSPYSGGAVEFAQKNGAVVLGRTNMDEFAMGSSTETSAHGLCRNPIKRDYIPGGSSGGSAAAVGGNQALVALGSDTGGSIRQPASVCGVVGLKPTYGRVSRYGLVAFGSSLDQIGPLAKTVEDTALILQATAGYDARDSSSQNLDVPDYMASLTGSLKGKKIGLPREYFTEAVDPIILEKLEAVKGFYQEQGCELVEVSLPNTEYAIGTYYVIATAEASANLARFDGVRYGRRSKDAKNLQEVYLKSRSEGFGTEVKRRILLGTYVLSSGYYDAYYVKAQKVRRVIKDDFTKAFEQVDAMLTPITPDPVFKIGERTSDPIKMYLSDIFTTSLNLSGVPGMSIPCGYDQNAMPIGFQLIAPHFQEETIFNLGHIYQKEIGN